MISWAVKVPASFSYRRSTWYVVLVHFWPEQCGTLGRKREAEERAADAEATVSYWQKKAAEWEAKAHEHQEQVGGYPIVPLRALSARFSTGSSTWQSAADWGSHCKVPTRAAATLVLAARQHPLGAQVWCHHLLCTFDCTGPVPLCLHWSPRNHASQASTMKPKTRHPSYFSFTMLPMLHKRTG